MTNINSLDFQLGRMYELLVIKETCEAVIPSFDSDFERLEATYAIIRDNANREGADVKRYPTKDNIPNSCRELWEIIEKEIK